MEESKLRALWGDKLFDYCYQKSIELIGYPQYEAMALAAIGKLANPNGVFVGVGVNNAAEGEDAPEETEETEGEVEPELPEELPEPDLEEPAN